MKIHRIRINSYRGIEALDEAVQPAGVVVSGGNGRGKTSVLRAIRAALAAQDIGPDAVRIGSDKAEILVDLDAVTVRRTITPKTSAVTVTSKDGMRAQKPQTFLSDLLGTSPLDPLDLLLAKPKERRAKVLEALPVSVTMEQLRKWVPTIADVDTSGHGLEVIARIRASYYAQRTAKNKEAEGLAVAHNLAKSTLDALESEAPIGAVMSVANAMAFREKAQDHLRKLEAQREASMLADLRSRGSRERIENLCDKVKQLRSLAKAERDPEMQTIAARSAIAAAEERLAELENEVQAEMANLTAAKKALASAEYVVSEVKRMNGEADQFEATAHALEATLAETATPAVQDSDVAAAKADVEVAQATVAAASLAEEIGHRERDAEAAATALTVCQAEAERLDAIVKTLSNEAPASLLANAQAIPGLGLDGDEVTLDGKRLDALCGSEQIRFCVTIAKRMNAKSKILIVDGLERLDVDQREEFVRFATADDWQLLATCVDRGAPVFAAIEADSEAAQ